MARARRFCTITRASLRLAPGLNLATSRYVPSPVEPRRQVEQIRDAVDLLLDQRRYRVGDHGRRGSLQ